MDVSLRVLLFLLILLILSAFFSSSETAFSSVNAIRLKTMTEAGDKGAKKALHITNNFDEALSTILVGNNLVNIAAATLSGQLAAQLFGANLGAIISTIVVTGFILIFGEILPKSFAKEYAELFTSKISAILLLLMKIIYPVNWIFLKLRKFVGSLVNKNTTSPSMTETELKMMVQIGEDEGIIGENEKQLVHRSFEFNDIVVEEIFTPRTNMVTCNINDNAEKIKNIFFRERYSRIPVFEDHIDNIIGVLSERDFLKAFIQQSEINLKQLVRTPIFVVESMKIHTLLPQLQNVKSHMAIVIDEYGGTAGLITMEDMLEEIVGEIYDEHDDVVKRFKQIDTSTFQFHADYPLDDFARLTNVELPDTTYFTIGGWLQEEFQRIPVQGNSLNYDHLIIKIKEADERRIYSVIVQLT
ncbi:hemolysin family protein [Salipaludibacillus sp. HK11]|uniref:hemolysin family protein n=1 Tax=Salipaludibacillus sp. HK11 TaxID=3394320 RepID=UPI0039FCDAB8